LEGNGFLIVDDKDDNLLLPAAEEECESTKAEKGGGGRFGDEDWGESSCDIIGSILDLEDIANSAVAGAAVTDDKSRKT
tara:strand:- start:16 stop:252 length:237 start_codon:yes stop_codon:yes gene_type:complete